MKKILSLLGTITLIGTSTTSLIACNTKYNETELKELKEKNNIKTKDGILEGIAPQEKPFNQVDNRGYYIIGKADKWLATKYKNNRYEPDKGGIIEDLPHLNFRLMIRPNTTFGAFSDNRGRQGDKDDGSYFKAVYRGNLVDKPVPNLMINKDGIIKVNE